LEYGLGDVISSSDSLMYSELLYVLDMLAKYETTRRELHRDVIQLSPQNATVFH
jgi:hypothetical protein